MQRSRWLSVLCLLVLASFLTPSSASATTEYFDHTIFTAATGSLSIIGFDDLTTCDNCITSSRYAGQGLTIVNLDGFGINVVRNLVPGSYGTNFITEANIHSPPNGISAGVYASGADGGRSDRFEFILTNPMTAAGLFVGNIGGGGSCSSPSPTVVEFLDGAGNVIASEAFIYPHSDMIVGPGACWDNRIFYGVISAIPIKKIRVVNEPFDGDDIVIDDVQFGTAAIVANAGPDQTVYEGQDVHLDGSGSQTLSQNPVIYKWTQVAGPTVSLNLSDSIHPTFVAPPVGSGSITLTFQLIVNNGTTDSLPDTVNITVHHVNRAPVAQAGPYQTVKEQSQVTLDGTGSYDPDSDPLVYLWTQTSGPTVTLNNPAADKPNFVAPTTGSSVTLTFRLTVSDGALISAPSFTTVIVERLNHPPQANAGSDVTVNELSTVVLDGTQSLDPDSDPLTFHWTQVSGPPVVLMNGNTAMASFTAPQVGPGGIMMTMRLTVSDSYGAASMDDVSIRVQDVNDPPVCQYAHPDTLGLWPPNHKLVPVAVLGVSDPNHDRVTISVTRVTQDEPVNGLGDGDTNPDAVIQGQGVLLRAERSGPGNGRVYWVTFTADDGQGGTCGGRITIGVPHSYKGMATDDGQLFNSLLP